MTIDATTPKGAVEYDATFAVAMTATAKTALADAKDYVIDSSDMLTLAGEDLQGIKRHQKNLEEKRTSITGPINEALRAINKFFKEPADFLDQAEKTLKGAMLTYTAEQERKAEQARREAEALARAERQRLAEIERQQQEQARAAQEQARAAAKAAEQAAEAGDARALAAAHAAALDAQSVADAAKEEAQATALMADVVSFTPAVVEPSRVSGISGRVTYRSEVDDFTELVKAVAAGTAPLECLSANDKFLNAQAKAFKKPGQLFPGVRTVAERGLSARAA